MVPIQCWGQDLNQCSVKKIWVLFLATMVPIQGYMLYLIMVKKIDMDPDHGQVWD